MLTVISIVTKRFQGEENSNLKAKILKLEEELQSEKRGYEQLLEKVFTIATTFLRQLWTDSALK